MPDYYLRIMVRVTEVEGILVARKTVLRISLFLFWLSSSALCWKWNSAQGLTQYLSLWNIRFNIGCISITINKVSNGHQKVLALATLIPVSIFLASNSGVLSIGL